MQCFVYLMASGYRGTLYVGVTSNLVQRVFQHKTCALGGFTSTHRIDRLVWFDGTGSIEAAIAREKQIKWWRRDWKLRMVEEENPQWRDLYGEIL